MLHPDWVSLMTKFKKQYGQHWHDDSLSSQSYFELFEERLAEGCLLTSSAVEEQAEQEAKKPEPARQLGLHLDGALMIQTKRRYMSSMPQTTEEFRLKYKVMSNCWLLAKMRQPGRHLYSDLTEHTFSRFCDELLSTKNFSLKKEIGGNKVHAPDWKLCLGYEHELRKEAIRLVTECGASIQSAWWQAYHNDHHRMENWQTFLRFDSNSSDSSKDKKIEKLEHEMAELRRTVTNHRSRSPRRGTNQSRQLSLPGPSQLELPAPPTPKAKAGAKG